MKKKIFISIIFAVVGLLLLSRINKDFFFNRATCKEKKIFYNYEFNDIVNSKYLDEKNHNYKTLILENLNTGYNRKIYIIHETGGLYSKINKGDTLRKKSKSLIVRNQTQNWIDSLSFDCKD